MATKLLLANFLLASVYLADPATPAETNFPTISVTREGSEINNQKPIIGILAHEYTKSVQPPPETRTDMSYIAASYIKFVESAGGRVVPIMSHLGEDYLFEIFKSVNGILFPGGLVSLNNSQYSKAAGYLYDLAIKENDAGTYFPLWGECLGFQWMMYHVAGSEKGVRRKCGAYNMTVPTNFTKAASKSRLYSNAPRSIIKTMSSKSVTSHSHKLCITLGTFKKYGLEKHYRILTTNYDPEYKFTFVSSTEAINYPFYALGFHPEKVLFEWWTLHIIAHSSAAVGVAQYFARFMVDEARKNEHSFKYPSDEARLLIYNFVPEYTGPYNTGFQQVYLFDRSTPKIVNDTTETSK